MLRWVALKRRIDNSDEGANNAMLGTVSPNPQQPGGSTTITPGPGMGPGGFGSSGGGETVVIGGVYATISSWTPSLITILVPAQGAYPCVLPVVVTTSGGIVAAGLDLMTVYPLITALSRTTSQPGASLTITGANFGAGTGTVTIDGHGATVTAWGASSVTVTVPAALTYPVSGAVVLTTAPGNVAVGPDYTITVPNPVITHAQQPAGTNVVTAAALSSVVLVGTHFGASQGIGGVTVHGQVATVTSWGDTAVTITLPAEVSYPDAGAIVLTTGGALTSNALSFTTTSPYSPFAAGFNGVAAYLHNDAAGTTLTIHGAFTIVGWVYRNAAGHSDALIGQYDSNQADTGWLVWTNGDNLGLVTNAGNVNTTLAVPVGAWHQFCIRGDGTNVHFSLDGGAEQTGTYAQAAVANPVLVGAYRTASFNPANARIDALAFALSDLGAGTGGTYYHGGAGFKWADLSGAQQADWESWWDMQAARGAARVDAVGNFDLADSGDAVTGVQQLAGIT